MKKTFKRIIKMFFNYSDQLKNHQQSNIVRGSVLNVELKL